MSDPRDELVSRHDCPNCGETVGNNSREYCYVGWPPNTDKEGGFCCSTDCARELIGREEAHGQ